MQVKWVRMLYSDFSDFTIDQESLISHHGRDQDEALDYVEGSLLMHRNSDSWTSFFSLSDRLRLMSLVTEHELLYCIEVAKFYDGRTQTTVDKVSVDRCQTIFNKRKKRKILAHLLIICACAGPAFRSTSLFSPSKKHRLSFLLT